MTATFEEAASGDALLSGPVSRRSFIVKAATGGGLLFGFGLPVVSTWLRAAPAAAATGPTFVGAWIEIGSDESITMLIGSAEMGQGVMTGLSQVMAEELMVDWANVRAVHAPPGPAYVNPATGAQLTGGSMSMRGYFQPLRVAAASVREMLVKAAAREWGVPVSDCKPTGHGAVQTGSGASRQTLTYGHLAKAAAKLKPPANPKLVKSFKLIGTAPPRLDIPAKVTGAAIYGIDVRLPGMVYAAVKHCPTIGGTLTNTPTTPSGCIAAVPLGNAVAVVADNTWKAMEGARAVGAQWKLPAGAADMTTSVISAQAQSLMATGAPIVAETVGDVDGALAHAAKTIDATYSTPYLAHACMEPLNCTASVTATSCEVWAPTQAVGFAQATAAAICGLDPSAVTVHVTFLGGGLGRKFEMDYVAQAVTVAKAVGKPVKLTWPREQDFGHDQYRPMMLANIKAGLDASGNVVGWLDRQVSPSILGQRGWLPPGAPDSQAVDGAVELPYSFGTRRMEWVAHPAAIPVGFWRSVGNSINCFAVESAIDELALAAAADPLAFRIKLLGAQPRVVAVLKAAAKAAGWGGTLPAGHAQGIAVTNSFGSIVAHVAEVSSPTAGAIKVHKISCAIDCGLAVNPDQVTAQMEGGIVHGLGAALWGRMTFTNGVADQKNFNNYRLVHKADMPKVTVTIVNSGGPIGGVGEPGVPPVAPAVANAYARLTGTRLRNLPLLG